MANNSILLTARMISSDSTLTIVQSAANGGLNFKVNTIAESQVTGLTAKLTTMSNQIQELEQGSIDLANYVAPAGIKLSTTDAAFEIVATAATVNGKSIVVEDDIANVLRSTQLNVNNGVAGLDAQGKLTASQIPVDGINIVIENGKVTLKSLRVNNTFTVNSVEDDVPVATDGTAGVDIEVGDQIVIGQDIASTEYKAGQVWIRVKATDGKISSDYANTSYKFNQSMDSMTQGSNNKFLSAAEYTVVSGLGDSSGNLTYNSAILFHAGNLNVAKSVEFTGTGATGNALTLAAGGVAFAKMVQSGAVPAGWTMAASQLTGELDPSVFPDTLVAAGAAIVNIDGTPAEQVPFKAAAADNTLTYTFNLSGDFVVSGADDAATLGLNTGTGAGQIIKLASAGVLPALSGANLTALNASNLATGTVPVARIGIMGAAAANRGTGYVPANSGLTVAGDGALSIDLQISPTGFLAGDGKSSTSQLAVAIGSGLAAGSGDDANKITLDIQTGNGLTGAGTATSPLTVVGGDITGLNASNLSTGTVPEARLTVATDTVKGIASFAAANFSVAAGVVTLKAATTTTLGGVKVAADNAGGLAVDAAGTLSLEAQVGTGLTGKGTTDSPLAVNTNTIATKTSVDTLAAQVTKLDQVAVSFTASDLVSGVLTITATRIPRGICKTDYTNLTPIFPDSMTAPNAQGQSSYSIDLTGFTLTGEWQVVF